VAGIMQEWTQIIGMRHQGVLVSAMRGCDLAPRHDPSKFAQRLLRGAVLIPHSGRFVNPGSYIAFEPNEEKWWSTINAFSASWDHYPNHYVMHFLHAAEIVGYYAPIGIPCYSDRWEKWYRQACNILHVNPESKAQLEYRLDADEEKFKELQKAYKRQTPTGV